MTMRLTARDVPVLIVVGILGAAVLWTVLVDLEALPAGRQWVPQGVFFLTVLLVPVLAAGEGVTDGQPSGLWVFVAPLAGLLLIAHYYAFDVYGSPPYSRNSEAGDMPSSAIYLGAAAAFATGILTWHRRRLGVLATVIVCFGCAVLVFFSNVFH